MKFTLMGNPACWRHCTKLWLFQVLSKPVLLRINQPALFGSFENQTPKRKRKRGIAALLEDTTNLPVSAASEHLERRASKDKAESRITVSAAPQYDCRGDSLKETKQHMQAGSCDGTLYRIFKNNREKK